MGIIRTKYIATAKITDPVAVQAYCASKLGWTYSNGAILVNILERGFDGSKYIYCRYGMSVPYIRVEVDMKVWVEPTIIDEGCMERFIYTGFVDCGNSSNAPSTTDLFIMKFTANNGAIRVENAGSGGSIKLLNGASPTSPNIEISSSKINICGSNFEVLV